MTFSNAEGHIPWHILAETLLHGNGKVYMTTWHIILSVTSK